MRSVAHSLSFVVAFSVLSACHSSRDAYAQARRIDTIESYQAFLVAYERSPEAPEARRRQSELEGMWERSQARVQAKATEGIARLAHYNVGTSRRDFLADGWNPHDPFAGRIGIVGAARRYDSFTYFLGTTKLSNAHGIDELVTNAAADANRHLERLERDDRVEAWRPARTSTVYCELTFRNDILDATTCRR